MGRIGGSVWAVAQSNELIVAGSGGFDPALRAWSKEGALVLEVKTPNNAGALAVDVHGNLAVVGTYTGAVYLVDVLSGAVVYVLQGHTDAVWDVVLDGGVVFSGSWDGSIRMWDASTGVCTSTISVGSKVGGLATQDDFIVVGFKDSTVQVFSKSTGERVHIFSVPTVWAKSIAMNDKHLVTGSDDRRIRVYDVPSFELLHTLEGHTSWVNSVALDGDTIVSSSWDRTIKVWDATDGQELRTLHGHSNAVQSVSLLGSDIVSGSWDCSVKIWDVETGAVKRAFDGTEASPSARTWGALALALEAADAPPSPSTPPFGCFAGCWPWRRDRGLERQTSLANASTRESYML